MCVFACFFDCACILACGVVRSCVHATTLARVSSLVLSFQILNDFIDMFDMYRPTTAAPAATCVAGQRSPFGNGLIGVCING